MPTQAIADVCPQLGSLDLDLDDYSEQTITGAPPYSATSAGDNSNSAPPSSATSAGDNSNSAPRQADQTSRQTSEFMDF